MDVRDTVVVVSGGASGIGAALVRRFHADGARHVVVVDRNLAAATEVAGEVGGVAEQIDVSDAAAVSALVARTVEREGRLDVFCSNAGIATGIELEDPDDLWHRALEVNLMAHVYAARAVVPVMLSQGRGYLVNTASAAGLLVSPGDAPYTASKHAAVGFAEHLAVTYGDRGIGVSVVCPLGVATPLLMDPLAAGDQGAAAVAASGTIITAEVVADAVLVAMSEDRFLVLPHPEVGTYWAQKASDPQRWLRGMRRLVAAQQQ